jgi:hypothetical protein
VCVFIQNPSRPSVFSRSVCEWSTVRSTLEWRRRKPGADRKCPPRSASQSLRRSIHPWLLELTIASSDITLELISLLEGAWTHRRFRSWLLATRIPSGRSSFALTLRGPTHAPQVTHDRPQIFPLTDRFLPLLKSGFLESTDADSVSFFRQNDNRHHGARDRRHTET